MSDQKESAGIEEDRIRRDYYKIDLSGLDCGGVKEMSRLFTECDQICDLTLFKVSEVKNTSEMFPGCLNLKWIDLSDFDSSCVLNMNGMFKGCSNLYGPIWNYNIIVPQNMTRSLASASHWIGAQESRSEIWASIWSGQAC